MNLRAVLMIVAATASAGLVSGCGSTPAGNASAAASAGAAGGSSAAPAASSAPATSAAPGAVSAPAVAGAAPWCGAAGLAIAYTDNAQIRDGALAGMSHADSVVTLTNIGHAACRTAGYPGVAALGATGQQVMQAARAPGAAPVITLAPGQVASALISGNTASCATVSAVSGLLVTAPDQRTSTRLGPDGSMCLNSLQVHPLAPGNAGGLSL